MSLADEQEQAIRVACSDRQFVVIVGQAGTGKSTALLGVARAHEREGLRVLVTSTGAQAAERLASELREGGVDAHGYSTMALRVGVEHGRLELGPDVMVIHDEAALGSTREQAWLFGAAAKSHVRLVEVGDPRQSQAVGAAGLWPELEKVARENGGLVELSRIVRARDPADRRDQSLFRSGQHERALEGYAERGRVVFEPDRRRAEDRALEAAQADRVAGSSTLVIAQTSNEQLDALNARAQAIRAEHGELGAEGVPVSQRPYSLHAGDEVVVRAPVRDEDIGAVRNGTRAVVIDVDSERERAGLRLSDARETSWGREQIDAGQVRLAYVQHPFPAQGITTDTAHLIAGPLSTAEGSYVGLTRARETTRVYTAEDQLDLARDGGASRQRVRLGSASDARSPRWPRSECRSPTNNGSSTSTSSRPSRSRSSPARGARGRARRADRLRGVVATYPAATALRASELERTAERSRRLGVQAREQADQHRERLEGLGRRASRGAEGERIRQTLAERELAVEREQRDELKARAEVETIQQAEHSPARWDEQHPGARGQLQRAEQEFDQALDRHAARAIEEPSEQLRSVLGERPPAEQTFQRDAWDQGALAIERYRASHQIDPAEDSALGSRPDQDSRAWEQRGDWRQAGERVLEARERLGIAERGYGPVEERIERVQGLVPEQDRERALDRGHGFEM